MTAPPALLVDIDGTLVDTNYLHVLAWRRAFCEHGHDVPSASIHRFIGAGSEVLLSGLVGDGFPDLEKAWHRHFEALMPEIAPLPGAARFLRAAAGRGVSVVLATSSPSEMLDAYRAAIDADDAISAVVSAGDVDGAKPSPEVFDVAMAKVGADASSSLAVGDTVWDVRAAARAGVGTVCVLTGGIGRAELVDEGAAAVYRDLEELVAELDHSPLARLVR